MISNSDKEMLLALTPSDLTFSKLVSLFGDTIHEGQTIKQEHKSHFNTTDEMDLKPNEYFNHELIHTTVGRFIFNKYLFERTDILKEIGYVNEVITNGAFKKMEAKLTTLLVEDKITLDQYMDYIDARDTLGMQLNSVITTSFTMNTIKTPPSVKKHRDELFKKYDKELKAGDIVVSEKIEKQLTSEAKEILKNDPGMDLYNSEARGNFGNYKNMNLFKGATMNNKTGQYEIVRSAFMDGIKKEDIESFGDAVVSGAYPKAVGTQESGYLAKEMLAAMQTEVIDKHGSDCGTKNTLEVLITSKNKVSYQYRYIMEGSKAVCLTPEVIDKYVGKKVRLRSPMYCTGEHICNICAGEMNYMLGTTNIGLGTSTIANVLLRLGMKKFHTANIKSTQIDIDDMLI